MIEAALIGLATSMIGAAQGNGLCDEFGKRFRATERYTPGLANSLFPDIGLRNYKFPRSRAAQERRMTQHIEWVRQQVDIRNRRRMKLGALAVFGPPAIIIVAGLLWRVAIYVMVN